MNKDNIAKKIADAFLNVQKRFAEFMNARTRGCSVRTLRLACIGICVIYTALSVWAIAGAFTSRHPPAPLKVSHLPLIPLVKDKDEPVIIVNADAHQRMQRFQKIMDSLRVCNRTIYDSILLSRPGLMDSVSILENIYIKQQR